MSAVGAGGQSARSGGFLDSSGAVGAGFVEGEAEGEHELAGRAVYLSMKPAQSGRHGAGGDEVSFEYEGAEDGDGDHERHGEIDRGSAGSDGGIGRVIHGWGRIIKMGFCVNCQFLGEKTAKNRGIWSGWGCL